MNDIHITALVVCSENKAKAEGLQLVIQKERQRALGERVEQKVVTDSGADVQGTCLSQVEAVRGLW